MLLIDGSIGEGGGQILRTSLGLSLLTGRPFQMINVRSQRKKPGLLSQHLTALQLAARIGEARIEGDDLGSSQITFAPQTIQSGDHRLNVGTAGSTTLVLQTVLPALMMAKAPSHLVLEGGTHNPLAPPFEFLEMAFLPVVRRMGFSVRIHIHQAGFYPTGGGRMEVWIDPSGGLKPIDLLERGRIISRKAVALISRLDRSIAQREWTVIKKELGWPEENFIVREIKNSPGAGNVVLLMIECEKISEVMVSFGRRGHPAEKVAQEAVDQAQEYLKTDCPIGPYLADQLLLPFALVGRGSFKTNRLTGHALTNMEIIRKFLDVRILCRETPDGGSLLSFQGG